MSFSAATVGAAFARRTTVTGLRLLGTGASWRAGAAVAFAFRCHC
jgi:hypothetical protein